MVGNLDKENPTTLTQCGDFTKTGKMKFEERGRWFGGRILTDIMERKTDTNKTKKRKE